MNANVKERIKEQYDELIELQEKLNHLYFEMLEAINGLVDVTSNIQGEVASIGEQHSRDTE